MKESSFKQLYISELKDLYSAETQLVETLPKVIDAIETQELKDAVSAHLEETRGHVDRLNQIFEMLGESSEGEECEAMKGLLEEGAKVMDEFESGAVRDAALIGACQRVEHYEIAAYGTTRAFAEILGLDDEAEILVATLEEESNADETLSGIAEETVNPAAKELVGANA